VAFGARVDAARAECQSDPASAAATTLLFDELEALDRVANSTATRLLTEDGDTLSRIEKNFASARARARARAQP